MVHRQPEGHHGRRADRGDHVPGATLRTEAEHPRGGGFAARIRLAGEYATVRLLRIRLAGADHVLSGQPGALATPPGDWAVADGGHSGRDASDESGHPVARLALPDRQAPRGD